MKTIFTRLALLAFASVAVPALHAQSPAAPTATPALPEGLTTTESGLKYVITSHGSGPVAKVGQVAIVHYVGTFMDGSLLDSSRKRGEPFAFTLGMGRVIRGWDEGFALLRVGDQATFIIPPDLAYGPQKRGPIPGNSTLRFDVELLELKDYALADVLLETLDGRGLEATQRLFAELKTEKFGGLYVNETQLNGLGYSRLGKQKFAEAIAVLLWNAELFPASANVYDSLGEAYARNGQRELAIQNYERSLAIDPKNANAAKELARLKSLPAAMP
jgi:hypothetical protein